MPIQWAGLGPELLLKLAPLETLRLSVSETYRRYPSPQRILAIARGQQALPDDPQERMIVQKLVDHYRLRKTANDLTAIDAAEDTKALAHLRASLGDRA